MNKALRDMDAGELRERMAQIRERNPHTFERLQSYRNTRARLRRLETARFAEGDQIIHRDSSPESLGDFVMEVTPAGLTVRASQTGEDYEVAAAELGDWFKLDDPARFEPVAEVGNFVTDPDTGERVFCTYPETLALLALKPLPRAEAEQLEAKRGQGRRYFVEIEAFGHVLRQYVNAASEAEALEKLGERVGLKTSVEPVACICADLGATGPGQRHTLCRAHDGAVA